MESPQGARLKYNVEWGITADENESVEAGKWGRVATGERAKQNDILRFFPFFFLPLVADFWIYLLCVRLPTARTIRMYGASPRAIVLRASSIPRPLSPLCLSLTAFFGTLSSGKESAIAPPPGIYFWWRASIEITPVRYRSAVDRRRSCSALGCDIFSSCPPPRPLGIV